ncbi:MAG: peroxidase [Planctomycetes bacterium]|nr:peroxidase [Planctomycetota bacterium]
MRGEFGGGERPEAGVEREAWLAALAEDWRGARLLPEERELCAFAEKLTRTPAAMSAADVEVLRHSGLDDRAIHEAIQVVAYFNYINRVADAVHVDLEPGMRPYPA